METDLSAYAALSCRSDVITCGPGAEGRNAALCAGHCTLENTTRCRDNAPHWALAIRRSQFWDQLRAEHDNLMSSSLFFLPVRSANGNPGALSPLCRFYVSFLSGCHQGRDVPCAFCLVASWDVAS
jgi:hypothetical protein